MSVSKPVLLVVDDKRNMLRLITKIMKDEAVVHSAESGAEALRILKAEPVNVVLSDLKMPEMDGIQLLKACRESYPDVEFVLMTAFATVGTAVDALRLGAYDYLTKPLSPDTVKTVLMRAFARVSVPPTRTDAETEVLPGVVARSEVMTNLARMVRRIAESDSTALLLGETGTGKERFARAIHQLSPRASKRFVAVNCASIPSELLESELFGHVKGAFTGAAGDHKGLFEEADGGTLFLDEIGDMRPSLQAKLTRTLEERSVRRVGESRERPVNIRLIAATHRDLQAMVTAGTFREDLWYRLNVATIKIPPLRQRRDDIGLLARHFLREQAESGQSRRLEGLTPAALGALGEYDWPGNVRQLKAAIERASVVSEGSRIDLGDLPEELRGGREEERHFSDLEGLTWAEAVKLGQERTARHYLESVLQTYGGRIVDAAAHAGVERESFYRLLRRHGIDPGSFRSEGSISMGGE